MLFCRRIRCYEVLNLCSFGQTYDHACLCTSKQASQGHIKRRIMFVNFARCWRASTVTNALFTTRRDRRCDIKRNNHSINPPISTPPFSPASRDMDNDLVEKNTNQLCEHDTLQTSIGTCCLILTPVAAECTVVLLSKSTMKVPLLIYFLYSRC